MRDDSKHIINYPWLFYTVANSDVILSGREEETWFIQSGVLFSLKKKGLGTIDMLASHSPSVLLGNPVAEQQTKDVSKMSIKSPSCCSEGVLKVKDRKEIFPVNQLSF